MGFTAFGLSILAKQGGAIDSESVLPMVLNQVLPVGIKGLVLAGLLAAFMSTFDSALNVAASFIVNDLVKPVWKNATSKDLMRISYAATLGVVILGILISLRTDRIAEIWNPINFALGAALLAPGIMASYWWRISGWAVCISCACTLPMALIVYFYTDLRELQYFPVLAAVSFSTCLLATFLCPATPDEALAMAEAGVDNIIVHFGNSSGGSTGSQTVMADDSAISRAAGICDALAAKHGGLIVTCHGGSIETPADFAGFLAAEPRLDGYVGGSSAERFPIEASVPKAAEGFKSVRLPGRG